ncbi:MAG TPA: CHAT domain-containing tetratricopeptide repeat protein [Thermoanaerobaculaceae bacterium]|nr:CHAT domain-containing tetratricopeptide repeat protein [Thermoanaerobaculaceae bacterium]
MRGRGGALVVAVAVALTAPWSAPRAQQAAGPAPPPLAQVRESLAQGAYGDAERAGRAALAALERAGNGESLAAADALDLVVAAMVKAGRERGGDARQLAERALSVRARLQGRGSPEATSSVMGLADVLRRNGEFRSARPLYEEALATRERAFGPESVEAAESANGLGNLLYDTGDYAGARALFERVLAIRVRALGPERPEVADALFNLAAAARNTGNWAGSRDLLERSLAIREKAFGADHPMVAATLNNLALALKQAGEFAGARRCYERALAIWEKAYGPEHAYVAGVLNNLASLAIRMGDTTTAKTLLERSLAIRQKALGPSNPEVAQCLSNLAMVLNDTGDRAGARALLDRSLAIRENALGPGHRDVAATLVNLGEVLLAAGDAPAARAAHERALAIRETALGPDHPAVAESLHALAQILGEQGELDVARRDAERAVAIWTKAFGSLHPSVAEGSLTLARLLARAGDRTGALAAALRAEEVGREHLRCTAHLLTEREALRYAIVRANGRDLALSLAVAVRDDAETRTRVWESVAASRNVVFDATSDRRRLGRSARAAEVEPFVEEFVRATEELSAALVRASGDDASERGRSVVAAAREREERAERALAERSTAFAADRVWSSPKTAAVAASLPAGSALVSFVRYRHDAAAGAAPWRSHRPAAPESSTRGEWGYLALVLRAGDPAPALVPLGPAGVVEALVERWAAEAARGPAAIGRTPASALLAYREAGRALRKVVWDPVAPHLAGERLALLVPDGALHLVSWAALPAGRAGYLVEGLPVLHLLTAERDAAPTAPAPGAEGGLLAVGGAAFDSVPSGAPLDSAPAVRGVQPCVDLGTARFEPLPGAAREADEVAALWRARAAQMSPPSRGDDVVVLKGDAATEGAFKADCLGRRVLHIATHGFFSGTRCADETAGSRGVGGLAPAATRPAGSPGETPPVISGLALAGANNRRSATPSQEDGVLTSEEIATLDLQGTQWAVLSACETGVGELHASEGVLGLQRAFRAAGVRTVIMSLWTVGDVTAREWMEALYEARLRRGCSTAAAVRAASLAVLASRRSRSLSTHPASWGAFVATGDWN